MTQTFIGVYDNALTKKECDILISHFETSPQHPGCINYEDRIQLKPDWKQCIQLRDAKFSDNSLISNILWTAVNNNWSKYQKNILFLVVER